MTAKTHHRALPLTSTERIDDEFYYGYRTIITYDEEGKEVYSYKPLTLDDFLDPQEGDLFMQGTLHDADTDKLKSIFRYLYQDDPTTAVYSDLKILWGIEGLAQPAPDIMVIPNVKDPDKPRQVFDITLEGVRPRFVLEVVSPRYRQPDRDKKVAIYERAGVEEYFIIDSWLQGEQISYEILGYRLQEDIYTEIQPDERGWLFSRVNQVWLGVNEAKNRFFVSDGRTGERLLTAEERAEVEAAARRKAEARVAELEMQLRELEARYQTQSGAPDDE